MLINKYGGMNVMENRVSKISKGGAMQNVTMLHFRYVIFIFFLQSFLLFKVDAINVLQLIVQLEQQRIIFFRLCCKQLQFFSLLPSICFIFPLFLPLFLLFLHLFVYMSQSFEVLNLHHKLFNLCKLIHARIRTLTVMCFYSFLQSQGSFLSLQLLVLFKRKHNIHLSFTEILKLTLPSFVECMHFLLMGHFDHQSLLVKLLRQSSCTTTKPITMALLKPALRSLIPKIFVLSNVVCTFDIFSSLFLIKVRSKGSWDELLRVSRIFGKCFIRICLLIVRQTLRMSWKTLKNIDGFSFVCKVIHAKQIIFGTLYTKIKKKHYQQNVKSLFNPKKACELIRPEFINQNIKRFQKLIILDEMLTYLCIIPTNSYFYLPDASINILIIFLTIPTLIQRYNIKFRSMSALEALGISGFRSYSPQALQKIDFQTPLTLIWGKNGSGKTTIIEVLKYITTGALPPSCDKGKNFIMDPKIVSQSELIGDARLKFRAFNGRPVLAKRRTLLAVTTKGAKFESIEQTLKTKDQRGQMFEINHHCAQIEKQIPQLLGISKAVLQNIVFCHQDESLWPFSDNANLKAIFDEMFQTRKYTKIIDLFWDQHKEYMKQVKQTRKSLDYMKRLYDEDNRKKRQTLRDLERVTEQVEELSALKEKLDQVRKKVKDNKEANDLKYELVKKRGSLEEKVNSGNRLLTQLKQKINNISNEYNSIFEVPPPIRIGETLTDIERKISQLNILKDDLQEQLKDAQNNNNFTQKQMQVLGEIKRAKQQLPELKNQSNEDEFLKQLQKKCEYMEGRRVQLTKMKRKLQQMVIPMLLELPIAESTYIQQKKVLISQTSKIQQCKQQILTIYSRLHRVVSPKRPQNYDSSVQSRLQQVQMRIKLKKQQLSSYQSQPIQEQSYHKNREKLQLSIVMQQNMYSFCSQKKKCFLCSNKINENDLKSIKQKCDKQTTKYSKKIEEIDEKHRMSGQQIDPQQIIPVLKKEIAKAEEEQVKLKKTYQQHIKYKQQTQQAKLNEKTIIALRKIGLDRQQMNAPLPHFAGNLTPQIFFQRISEYQNLRFREQSKGRDVKIYEQRVKKNKQIEEKREATMHQMDDLRQRMSECEQETQKYDLINNICKRLAELLKVRGSRKPNSKQKSSSQEKDSTSPAYIQKKLNETVQKLRGLRLQRELCIASAKVNEIQAEHGTFVEQHAAVVDKLRKVEVELEAGAAHKAQEQKINLQYTALKQQIDLKADIAFQEQGRPVQNEYLIAKMQLNSRQAAAHDLQMHCKAMEVAISEFHREKMDEVNKYLAQIWREVYHGEDISLIQVHAAFDEDSKRRKSYSYSIMMEKSGGKKMEMKGRCSMGQKVLASIVIRLALAEVFAHSARILALDEPTTNLDREHIVNLAHQLGILVQLNEGKNLQLIIISHDVQFVRMMQKYTPCYFEVSRDERRFSVITRRDIREIFQKL